MIAKKGKKDMFMQKFSCHALFAAALLATFPALAQNECRLTFSGYEGKETLKDFPALIKIPDGLTGFDYKDSTADGSDPALFADRQVVARRVEAI